MFIIYFLLLLIVTGISYYLIVIQDFDIRVSELSLILVIFVIVGLFLISNNNSLKKIQESCPVVIDPVIISYERIPFSNGGRGTDFNYNVEFEFSYQGHTQIVNDVVENPWTAYVCLYPTTNKYAIYNAPSSNNGVVGTCIFIFLSISIVYIMKIIRNRKC